MNINKYIQTIYIYIYESINIRYIYIVSKKPWVLLKITLRSPFVAIGSCCHFVVE